MPDQSSLRFSNLSFGFDWGTEGRRTRSYRSFSRASQCCKLGYGRSCHSPLRLNSRRRTGLRRNRTGEISASVRLVAALLNVAVCIGNSLSRLHLKHTRGLTRPGKGGMHHVPDGLESYVIR